MHSGVPVERGVRYVLVLFLISADLPDACETLKAMSAYAVKDADAAEGRLRAQRAQGGAASGAAGGAGGEGGTHGGAAEEHSGGEGAAARDESIYRDSLRLSIATLEQALQANDHDCEGWSLLARSYFRVDRYADAAHCYQRVVTLSDGRDFEALTCLARICTAYGRHAEALQALERAVEVGAPPGPEREQDEMDAREAADSARRELAQQGS